MPTLEEITDETIASQYTSVAALAKARASTAAILNDPKLARRVGPIVRRALPALQAHQAALEALISLIEEKTA